jgi:hypothetical protein
LNQRIERKCWLSKGSDRKQVKDRSHFDTLLGTYLPRHQGLFWCDATGFRRSVRSRLGARFGG